MNEVRTLLAGLNNTQAQDVIVRLDIVELVLGEEVADYLAAAKTTIASTPNKRNNLALSLAEMDEAKAPVEGLAKFNRLDLISCLEEAIEERGGLGAFDTSPQENSPLARIRGKLNEGKTQSSTLPIQRDGDSD